jgi:hypothetical protein
MEELFWQLFIDTGRIHPLSGVDFSPRKGDEPITVKRCALKACGMIPQRDLS